MTASKITKNDYLIFTAIAFVWVFLGWISYLLALGGFFYSWISAGFFAAMTIALLLQALKGKISFKISREFLIILSACFIFVLISSFFVTPAVFSGRDQGSISEAAIRLSQNHQLEFSTPASQEFFKIYGPGKALNFPGFYYTNDGQLITQFPIAYISWLAIFYSFFGLAGLIIANAVLLFTFLVSFYLLARMFLKINYSIILLALVASAFPVFWFFKFTLSENMAIALLWLSVLQAVIFVREKRPFFFFSFLISSGLLVFARIEGIAFLAAGFLAIYFLTRKKKEFWKEKRKNSIVYPTIFILVLFLVNFAENIYFYKEIGKALFHFGENSNGAVLKIAGIFSGIAFEAKIFSLYGLLGFLILGLFGIAYFISKKKWDYLIPFWISLPSFIYLVNPWISNDNPWMLRRFVFSIIPALIFYLVLFLKKWMEEKNILHRRLISYLVIGLFLISNVFLAVKYFTFSENKNLLKETEKISQNFLEKDLILVDRQASGDNWSMISGPMSFLYDKNSAYIFNPNDLGKIEREKFSRIFLIVPGENVDFYAKTMGKESLILSENYSISTERLISPDIYGSQLSLPQESISKTEGMIFEIK